MKTVIVYYSRHHGNTKKLVKAIRKRFGVDIVNCTKGEGVDLTLYDRIGFASGIYYSSFAKQLLNFAQEKLPSGKDVFYIDTCGAPRGNYLSAIRNVVKEKNCRELGFYQCLGLDTFGPFKLIGGIAKGHPSEEEVEACVQFYAELEGSMEEHNISKAASGEEKSSKHGKNGAGSLKHSSKKRSKKALRKKK